MNTIPLDQGLPISSDGYKTCQYCVWQTKGQPSHQCGSETKGKHGIFVTCTRKAGHQGPHMKCCTNLAHPDQVWEDSAVDQPCDTEISGASLSFGNKTLTAEEAITSIHEAACIIEAIDTDAAANGHILTKIRAWMQDYLPRPNVNTIPLDQGEPISSDGGESCQYCNHKKTSAGSSTCDAELVQESFCSYCSREKGHHGPHISCLNGRTIDHGKHVWPNDDMQYKPGYTAVNKKPPQREEACSKCKWYHPDSDYITCPQSGECRARPPKQTGHTGMRWASVSSDDFCGMFTAAHPKKLTDSEQKLLSMRSNTWRISSVNSRNNPATKQS